LIHVSRDTIPLTFKCKKKEAPRDRKGENFDENYMATGGDMNLKISRVVLNSLEIYLEATKF
jgi:hypothetical protein